MSRRLPRASEPSDRASRAAPLTRHSRQPSGSRTCPVTEAEAFFEPRAASSLKRAGPLLFSAVKRPGGNGPVACQAKDQGWIRLPPLTDPASSDEPETPAPLTPCVSSSDQHPELESFQAHNTLSNFHRPSDNIFQIAPFHTRARTRVRRPADLVDLQRDTIPSR